MFRLRAIGSLVGAVGLALIAAMSGAGRARAEDAPADAAPAPSDPGTASQAFAIHAQTTFVEQATAAFTSPYRGPNSLDPAARGRESFDATLYIGARLWPGAELWADPEIDQGFGLSDTLGLAGFSSGEAYKVGKATPYFRLQRAFIRQTIDLGGAREAVDGEANQLAGGRTADRLVITLGKFSVGDVFDANPYAHDPRADFFNWSVIDAGTFDYAADAWGYTYGVALEWYQGPWTLRAGLFDLSKVPNSTALETTFSQFQMILELERRYQAWGRPGAIRITGFESRGRMGSYADAIAVAERTGLPADIAAVRHYRGKAGVSVDVSQQITGALSLFARGGVADGSVEIYEFADIDSTASGGVSLAGKGWGRPQDAVGLAGVVNMISSAHQTFLADGGLGLLVGDGRLPHPGPERLLETYYQWALNPHFNLTVDYQFIDNPAYNRDRGPVSIFALRAHAQF